LLQHNTPHLEIVDDGDVITWYYRGTFDAEAYRRIVVPELITRLREPGRPRRVCVDFSEARARGIALISAMAQESRHNRPYEAYCALVGIGRGARRLMLDRIIALSGRRDLRTFDTHTEALAWLRAQSLDE